MNANHRPLFFLFAIIVITLSSSCGGGSCGGDKEEFLAHFDDLMTDVDEADLAVDDPQ